VATVEFMHKGSFRVLVGPDGDPTPWGVDTRIDEDTPPIFLWHTAEDKAVDVRNAYEVASACAAHDVPHEVHVFPKGRHGIGMLTLPQDQDPALLASAGQWPGLCARWLAGLGIAKDEA
jgi:acetyl esterase/lipase